jgi:ABC-type arginine transport system permease subunit
MIGTVEVFFLIIIALIYLAVPLITLVIVIVINQRLKNIKDLVKSQQE